jgi:hypothetical protein
MLHDSRKAYGVMGIELLALLPKLGVAEGLNPIFGFESEGED